MEYKEEEAHFVLVVIGCNGAWVDGVWSGSGSWVPLGERCQIQIASRTLYFVLAPPAMVEDSLSLSSASSEQSRTAPSLPPPKLLRSPDPQLLNSNMIPHIMAPSASTSTFLPTSTASTSKKHKKAANPPPKPGVMPPKPLFTYTQLCYWAIKAMGGKATL
ncbi:hypothetical protein L210DRAFT_3652730 [Boletus edulis BED1]|uniref:Uncharacterized protein n=1 Tax=Boletus edulis BED1 TaxID=1328754 RepID=A0AAD4BGI1_BOLED|nr:hypothetical protein L210DRAFT_3652730 [Boletus edulis BED1]